MPRQQVDRALAAARPVSFWLDQPGVARPEAEPALTGRAVADLAVVGGGFTGLWTALLAKEADPARDVVLLEGRRVAWAGTGRNGGFCSASLTHGLANGLDRFPAELAELERLGRRNLDEIEQTIGRYQIDCDFARSGELAVATQPWQAENLRETAALAARLGTSPRLLERRRRPRGNPLAGLSGRLVGHRRLRNCRPGPAGLGLAPRLPGRRRPHPRAHSRPGGDRRAGQTGPARP